MPTEEVEPAAGDDSVSETLAILDPAATSPQESEGAAAATGSAVGTTPESQKQTYVLSEINFD